MARLLQTLSSCMNRFARRATAFGSLRAAHRSPCDISATRFDARSSACYGLAAGLVQCRRCASCGLKHPKWAGSALAVTVTESASIPVVRHFIRTLHVVHRDADRKLRQAEGTAALPPISGTPGALWHLRFVPAAAIRWPRPSVSLTRHACLSARQNSPPGGGDISLCPAHANRGRRGKLKRKARAPEPAAD